VDDPVAIAPGSDMDVIKEILLALKVLQMDYPFSGPWGPEIAERYSQLARWIADVPGLICKMWTENAETGEAGGIYLFEDEVSLDSYLAGKLERMKASGIEGVRARKFDVNERLTQITRGRISE
jgi:Putative mono-oxygenase ydhR